MKHRKLTMRERRDRILKWVTQSQGSVRTIELLARLPGVSSALIGTDLNCLVEQGRIARVGHGLYRLSKPLQDASGPLPLLSDPVYWLRTAVQVREKQGIARYIVKNVFRRDGTYGLDSGSTVTMVFQALVTRRPLSAIRIVTNNIHGVLLVPPSSQFDLWLAGGRIAYDYAATCGPVDATEFRLDTAIVGFSRIAKQHGVWTFDSQQWPWKRLLCKAPLVVFAGTLDKIGVPFEGEAMRRLDDLEYQVVVDANATEFAPQEIERIEREREAFGQRLVLVDEEGNQVEKLMTKGENRE